MVGMEVVARGGGGGLEGERGGEREGLARINFAFCLKSYPTITKNNSPLTIAKCSVSSVMVQHYFLILL